MWAALGEKLRLDLRKGLLLSRGQGPYKVADPAGSGRARKHTGYGLEVLWLEDTESVDQNLNISVPPRELFGRFGETHISYEFMHIDLGALTNGFHGSPDALGCAAVDDNSRTVRAGIARPDSRRTSTHESHLSAQL